MTGVAYCSSALYFNICIAKCKKKYDTQIFALKIYSVSHPDRTAPLRQDR